MPQATYASDRATPFWLLLCVLGLLLIGSASGAAAGEACRFRCVINQSDRAPGNWGYNSHLWTFRNRCDTAVHALIQDRAADKRPSNVEIKGGDTYSDSCTSGRNCKLEVVGESCDSETGASHRAEGKFCASLPHAEWAVACDKACASSSNAADSATCKKWRTYLQDYRHGLADADGHYKKVTPRPAPAARVKRNDAFCALFHDPGDRSDCYAMCDGTPGAACSIFELEILPKKQASGEASYPGSGTRSGSGGGRSCPSGQRLWSCDDGVSKRCLSNPNPVGCSLIR